MIALLKTFWAYHFSLTGKVITNESVVPNSMQFNSITSNINYPEELRLAWKKPDSQILEAKFMKNNVEMQQLLPKIKSCIYYFSADDVRKNTSQAGYLLKISPQYCLINAHYLSDHITVTIYTDGAGSKPLCFVAVDNSNYRIVSHNGRQTDIAIISIPFDIPTPKLLDYWAIDVPFNQCDGRIVRKSREDGVGNSILETPGLCEFTDGKERYTNRCFRMKTDAPNGECGLPFLFKTNSTTVIFGIVGFRLKMGIFEYQCGPVCNRADLEETILKFDEPYVREVTCVNVEHGALSLKSSYRNIDNCYLVPLGTTNKPSFKFKSNFKKTRFYDSIDRAQKLKKAYGIPTKTYFVRNDKCFDAFVTTFQHLPHDERYRPSCMLKATNACIVHDLRKIEESKPGIQLSPLTLKEAFLGCQEIGVDRCNFKSSIGSIKYPGVKTRADLFVENEQGMHEFSDTFKKQFQEFHDRVVYFSCLEPMYISANYKDEIRSLEKLETASIRVFYTCDINWNLLCKMYVGPIANLLLDFPEITGMFSKLDSSSFQWDKFAHYLMIENDNWEWFDLDFKCYDVTHRIVIRYVALYYWKISKRYYTEAASCVVYYCVYIIGVKLMEHKGDLCLLTAGLPSGFYVTLNFNGSANRLMMLYAYAMIFPNLQIMTFFDRVKPAVQGDDNLSAVRTDIVEAYNTVSIAEVLTFLGYIVTNANKSLLLQPTVSIEEARFLKRGFRKEIDVGNRYLAPIETDSIWKMLSFWEDKGKEGISESERMAQCLDVAQREFFFHGREVFEKELIFLKELSGTFDIPVSFFCYEDLVQKYLCKDLPMNWI
jgi:hypothetical protein